MCGAAGEPPPAIDDESTDARRWKSCANCCSMASEVDERPHGENLSESVVPSDNIEVIRLMPNALGQLRKRPGPGSLSTVAKEMIETPLGRSVEDMDRSSSKSLRRAFDHGPSRPMGETRQGL